MPNVIVCGSVVLLPLRYLIGVISPCFQDGIPAFTVPVCLEDRSKVIVSALCVMGRIDPDEGVTIASIEN